MTVQRVARRHERNHAPGPIESCYDCGKQRAKCRSKVFRYTDIAVAILDCRAMNQANNYAKPLRVYGCMWCDEFHLTSNLRHRRRAVMKEKHKWLFQQELERRKRARDGS